MTNSLLRYCFIGLLILLPTQLGLHFWPEWAIVAGRRIDYFAPTVYLTDVLIFGLFVLSVIESANKDRITGFVRPAVENEDRKLRLLRITEIRKRPFLLILLILLTSLVLLNVPHSYSPAVSVYKWLKVAEFGFLFWFLRSKTINSNKFPLVALLLIPVFYESILAVWQFISQSSIGGMWYFLGERTFNATTLGIATAQLGDQSVLRAYGTFSHPNVLGGFLAVVLPLQVYYLLFKRDIGYRLIRLVVIGLGYLTLLLTLSRTAIVVGLGATLVVLVKKLEHRWQKLLVILLTLVISLILFSPLTSLGTEFESLFVRSQLNSIALQQFIKSPLVGTGLGTSPLYTLQQSADSGQRLETTNFSLYGQPIHNIYLLILSETGLIDFIIFIVLLLYCFIYRPLTPNRLPLTAILILGLFDHYFFTLQQGQLLFIVILALAMKENRDKIGKEMG